MENKKRESVSWFQVIFMLVGTLFALYGLQHMAHHSNFRGVEHAPGCHESTKFYIVHHADKMPVWECEDTNDTTTR